jgi:hypothetical protein
VLLITALNVGNWSRWKPPDAWFTYPGSKASKEKPSFLAKKAFICGIIRGGTFFKIQSPEVSASEIPLLALFYRRSNGTSPVVYFRLTPYTWLVPRLTIRPGVAPVCCPFLSTRVPFTHTPHTPVESWCGFSNVARSAIVSASKSTTSA